MDLRRRQLLQAGALALGLPRLSLSALASTNPFTLGVASGDPASDGFVIWTRLAPLPLQGGGMPDTAVEVQWQVGNDEQLRGIAQAGSSWATPEWGHSVHVEVGGLQPDRWYWYRFRAGGDWSPVGRARTTPARGAPSGSLRFAFASCQHYENGYYAAYRHMVAENPDLIVHLGDYIYESNMQNPLRAHGNPVPRNLLQYRNRHAVYKLDADLQRAHAACPWLVIWDDHDVENDYAGDFSPDLIGEPLPVFLAHRAAAYQAWYEHMPLRASARPDYASMRLFRSVDFGGLARFHLLDTRQYRSDQPCGDGHTGAGMLIEDCADRRDPARTMFGAEQEGWLARGLQDNGARWNVIAQSMLMAQLDHLPGRGERWWSDGWDGYPAARRRLLGSLQQSQAANPVVIGGDIHSFWAADLQLDAGKPRSPVVASEFTGTSISSIGVPYEGFAAMLPENPHIRYFESRKRGYALCELGAREWRTQFRGLHDVRDPGSPIATLASFAVEAGRPGVQRA